MNRIQRIGLGAAVFCLALGGAGCGGKEEGNDPAAAAKKAYEAAGAELKKAVGIISAYQPHLGPQDSKDKYAPKRRADLDRAATYAADEIRHAANIARQRLERSGDAIKDLVGALRAVSKACADAADQPAVEKCAAAVKALDEVIQKTDAASAAAGAGVKLPRVAPDSITDEAKKSLATFMKVRGPGPAEAAYIEKRADEKIAVADLISACQAAAEEAGATQSAFEKADEPLRLIGVTHKMSVDSQCNGLNGTDALRKDLEGCRKKAKSSECAIVCGKAKNILDEGVPAAAFTPLEKDYADICAK
ncbi:MAG: hypothetical protein IT372_40705 [Polyangiaceae bacterium]|nr:hypothetical protein [Polyangiaceae bacterium]